MKYMFFALVALVAAPVVADEPADLSSLGLVGLEAVSEADAMEIRGQSSSTNALSVNSLASMFYDPATGSQFNFEAASVNYGESDMTVGDANSSGGEVAVGNTAIAFEVGTFSASLGQSALFAGGQAGAQGAFTFSLNVPSFN